MKDSSSQYRLNLNRIKVLTYCLSNLKAITILSKMQNKFSRKDLRLKKFLIRNNNKSIRNLLKHKRGGK